MPCSWTLLDCLQSTFSLKIRLVLISASTIANQTLRPCLSQLAASLLAYSVFCVSSSGEPNDGFVLNALKTLFRQVIQSTLRSLEKHFKRRCKIRICSVILGEFKSFRNYQGLSIIFPKILDEIWRITKVIHFLIPLSITFLNPKILGFLFFYEKKPNLGSKMRKLNCGKS